MEQENMQKAIAAHGQWKERLIQAIEAGQSDFDPQVVKQPDQCEFGKWLYGSEISAEAKRSSYYEKAVDLHAKFHVEAGQVLSAALQGDKDGAKGLMAPESEFSKLSSTLTDTLKEWSAT